MKALWAWTGLALALAGVVGVAAAPAAPKAPPRPRCSGASDCPGGTCGTNGACLCGAGRHFCAGSCVSNASTLSCGSSCTACPGDVPGGRPACVAGACRTVCEPGTARCGAACVPRGTTGWGLEAKLVLDPGGSARQMALGDLDGDGFPDLVRNGYGLGVHLGKGDGTFGPLILREAGFFDSLQVADLNGDGKADIFAKYTYNLYYFPGNGDGTLGAAVNVPVPSFQGRSIESSALADLDGDGTLDVVAARPATLVPLLGKGDGSFRSGLDLVAMSQIDATAVRDLDGDGYPDLILGGSYYHPTGGNLNAFRGISGGRFQFMQSWPGDWVGALAWGDVDGDGNPDLIAVGASDVRVLRGAGTGLLPPVVTSTGSASNLLLGVADLDGDGRADVALALQDPTRLVILRGQPDGTLVEAASVEMPRPAVAGGVADLDRDGWQDVVFGSDFKVWVFRGGCR